MQNELKPCPFCGGEADFIGEGASIKCKNCGGAFLVINPFRSRYEVAKAWNTRIDHSTEEDISKDCGTCLYFNEDSDNQPCCSCVDSSNWEEDPTEIGGE